jgi:hypothetical protein
MTTGGFLGIPQPCDVKRAERSCELSGFGPGRFDGESVLIVDAAPLDAEVFLDGGFLGPARVLIARALPLAPGRHAVEIVAPGFRSYITRFTTDPGAFPTTLRVTLTPE